VVAKPSPERIAELDAGVLADPRAAVGHALLMSALTGGDQVAVFLEALTEAGFQVRPLT